MKIIIANINELGDESKVRSKCMNCMDRICSKKLVNRHFNKISLFRISKLYILIKKNYKKKSFLDKFKTK